VNSGKRTTHVVIDTVVIGVQFPVTEFIFCSLRARLLAAYSSLAHFSHMTRLGLRGSIPRHGSPIFCYIKP